MTSIRLSVTRLPRQISTLVTRAADERQHLHLAGVPLDLELGGTLAEVTVAYETYGHLNQARDNAVLVCHALTGDSHVVAHPTPGSPPGWWEGVIGPGLPVDTDRHFVICANVLGGCRGTTGPRSVDPRTGQRYGTRFPVITIGDMVEVQHLLVRHLGLRRLALVVGGSMGGMQALEWAVRYPDLVERTAILAAPARTGALTIALNEIQRQAIMRDPAWQDGHYEDGAGPAAGLGLARMVGMLSYQWQAALERKFGRRAISERAAHAPVQQSYAIESYLHHQGIKLADRFDATSYLYLLRAIDLFDLSLGHGTLEAALAPIRARLLVVGVSSDILYPTHQQVELAEALRRQGKQFRYIELDSPCGHDGFLTEVVAVGELLSGLLAEG